MISIICAYNNEDILNKMLKASLNRQSFADFELILIDAQKEGFGSAAETLNVGAKRAKGDILVFLHQDIEMIDEDFLIKVNNYCMNNEFGIAGVCGVKDNKKYVVYSSVLMGRNRVQAGVKNTDVMDVYALDECILICKKKTFKGFEDYGKTWHFYGVEYAYRCKANNERVLILPYEIYHLSPGWSLDYSYFDTLLKVAKRYPNRKIICTCMGFFNNNRLLGVYCLYRKFKIFLKRKLGLNNVDS